MGQGPVGAGEIPTGCFGESEFVPGACVGRSEADRLAQVLSGASEVALLEGILAGALEFLKAGLRRLGRQRVGALGVTGLGVSDAGQENVCERVSA